MSYGFSFLVVSLCAVLISLKVLLFRKLAKITVEISNHLLEEDYCLGSLDVMLIGEDFRFHYLNYVMARTGQLLRDVTSRFIKC